MQVEAGDEIDALRLPGVKQIPDTFPQFAGAGDGAVERVRVALNDVRKEMLDDVIDLAVCRGRVGPGSGMRRPVRCRKNSPQDDAG